MKMYGLCHHDWSDGSDYFSIQARKRYEFACAILPPESTVMDIGCGAGLGSSMLESHGHAVVPVDFDDRARALVRADALQLPFKDETFDAIVTFETIEHVPDGHLFLQEMRRVLRPGGTIVISTPNIRFTSHPPFHIKEYGIDEFFSLVEEFFPQVERYAQYFRPIDRVRDIIRNRFWHIAEGARRLRIAPILDVATRGAEDYYEVKRADAVDRLRVMVAVGRKG
jgi:ubiquinone/menaquinone biosynthesis C-methylase UbiE